MVTRRALTLAATAAVSSAAVAQGPEAQDPRLTVAASLDVATNGVATTRDGRVFMVLVRLDGSSGPRIVEWRDGTLLPYPDAAWNAWAPGADPARMLVRANALRIGPEGDLWIVDVGAPGFGNPKLPGGPKLVQVDVGANAVRRTYSLDAATNNKSFIDDVRFNGGTAYVTDAGSPGIIILDLGSGATRRVIDGDPSTTAQKPMSAEGHEMRTQDGKPVMIHADQLEVSPDGRWLYYQPCPGPLHRIETRWLDASVGDEERARRVQPFVDTPATGGTAIDAQGNIYLRDTDRQRILRISPAGQVATIVQDPRLLWVDAMWIDHDGDLWMPAAQINRIAPFQGGVSRVQYPMQVFKLTIGAFPPELDHP